MPTKADISEEMNEKLDTDIEWDELKEDDLNEFRGLIEEKSFVKRIIAINTSGIAADEVEDIIMEWEPGDGVQILKEKSSGALFNFLM